MSMSPCEFGHISWPELSEISEKVLCSEQKVLERCLNTGKYYNRTTYFLSMKNLYGYILWKLKCSDESIAAFESTLEFDNENINAISNLKMINRHLGFCDIADGYQARLCAIIGGKDNAVALARSYCDRAHSIRHFEQDKRNFSYMPFISEAVKYCSLTNSGERAEWQFDYGLALYRKDLQMTVANMSPQNDICKQAMEAFYSVAHVENGPLMCRALAWVFIGILLRHKPSRKLSQILQDAQELHGMTSLDCIERGLAMAPDDPVVQRRVASEFTLVGRFDEADNLFIKSLASESSWFAYRHQGLMYLRKYEDDTQKNPELLHDAQRSFQEALKLKDLHADHSDLGHVYYLLKNYKKAVYHFSHAKNSKSDDHCNPGNTHSRWACCLEAMGHQRGAEEHYCQAKLEHFNTEFRYGSICHGIDCDLSRFDYCTKERHGFVNILSVLSENEPPGNTQETSWSKRQETYDFFVSFSHVDRHWARSLVFSLEKTYNLNGCLRYRNYLPGESISTNIVSSIEKSSAVIIVLSPDSLEDHWCSYELEMAVNTPRKYIIPIKLRSCQIPSKLKHLSVVDCDRGQLLKCHWKNIGTMLSRDRDATSK
ncbi:uncharacterized protein LOC117101644 [Anneissia japonica]|uniref:uncharacterized protein LOC117101644 n=1 Tax=Anneissia japonica TaxID=1529436 RepID=UPI0014256771|nr:uncharacterized protein LOC117101644 [Anneissia japonica]